MKTIKNESMKSMRSTKSYKAAENVPNDIPEIIVSLPAACVKYNCSYTALVKKAYQQDEFTKKKTVSVITVKSKKSAIGTPFASVVPLDSEKKVVSALKLDDTNSSIENDVLEVTAVYDSMQRFVELILNNIGSIPRSFIQIIRLLVPFYEYLTKLSFFRCILDSFAIYEINKMLSITTITDLCFDGTKIVGSDIATLLDNKKACIKYISLSGCKINDDTCQQLALRLHYSAHAETTLLLLNLSSNHITDEGAKHLGEFLRTNRHLRYLNLGDNRIGDDGAYFILNSLIEFVLTNNEIWKKRSRYLEYLKAKRLMLSKYLDVCDTMSSDETSHFSPKRASKRKKTSLTSIKYKTNHKSYQNKDKGTVNINKDVEIKVDVMANDLIGPFIDPFAACNVKNKDEYIYCVGNMTLSYLNLSYNKLMYPTIKKLVEVIQYQKTAKKISQSGLIKVVIEGNNIPITCDEYQILNDITPVSRGLNPFGMKLSNVSGKRKTRLTSLSSAIQPSSSGGK